MKDLKTDYKDAVHSGPKQFKITTTDGVSNIDDITKYTAAGDKFGAGDINATNEAINRLARRLTVTLPASGWSASSPYTQRVAVSGVLATDSGEFACDTTASAYTSGDTTLRATLKAQAGFIDQANSEDGYVTFMCRDFKPTQNLPIVLLGA